MIGRVAALGGLVVLGLLLTLATRVPIAQVTPFPIGQATSGAEQNQYCAEPILSWDASSHRATFGVRFTTGNPLNVEYHGKIWIQLYYRLASGSRDPPQLMYDVNASIWEFSAATWGNRLNLTWEKPYTFTQWNDGKHDLIVNVNWVDSRNLTNWCDLDGSPMPPFSVWNGSACIHHIDWEETVDFTAPPPPTDYTVGIIIGGSVLVMIGCAVVYEGIDFVKSKRRPSRRNRYRC